MRYAVWIVTALCVINAAIALWALMSRAYRESAMQWVGLWLVTVGALLHVDHIVRAGYVSMPELLLAVGITAYAIGTARKVYLHHVRYRRGAGGAS